MAMHPFLLPRTRRSLVAALVAALTVGGAFSDASVRVASAADTSSDIPGVPLPGPIAAGRLGGDVYDVVYSFTVGPGHVIVASLTGTAGTDFDMYLFDASAATIQSTTGLLTKSTGPDSTESISWATEFGGTFYINLNGATDIEGDYRLTVQAVPDGTPPALEMMLAGGRPSTNQLSVPVSLDATDDLSGVVEVAFSPDGLNFEAWQPFRTSATWTFPPGDGQRYLWAKVRNGVGLESASAGASVMIDTIPPSVASIDPPASSNVVGLRPRLSVKFTEPIAQASWIDLGLIVQSASGALVVGAYSYDAPTRTGIFVPSVGLQPGGLYVVTVGDVKDVAGNRVVPPGSWSITPLAPTTLMATATPGVLLHGGSTRVDVSLAGAPLPATLEISSASIPAGFVPLTPIPTDDGSNTLVMRPASNTTLRFSYAGAFGVAPAQVDVRLLVRRSVVLAGRNSSVVSRAEVGVPVKLTTAVSPAAAGVPVSFRLYRFDTRRRAWVYAGSKGRSTDAAGRAVLSWVPPASGSWYWRVAVAPTADFANNTSPVYRWSVAR